MLWAIIVALMAEGYEQFHIFNFVVFSGPFTAQAIEVMNIERFYVASSRTN